MKIEFLKYGELVATVETAFPELEFHYVQQTTGADTWRIASDSPTTQISNETPLSKAKRLKKEELNMRCSAELVGGIYSAALGDMHKYDSDIVDQLNFTQALMMSLFCWLDWREKMAAWVASHAEHEPAPVETPVPYRIWNADGVSKGWYGHKCMQFVQVLRDGATAKATLLFKCSQLKAVVDSLNDIDAVNLVSWDVANNG